MIHIDLNICTHIHFHHPRKKYIYITVNETIESWKILILSIKKNLLNMNSSIIDQEKEKEKQIILVQQIQLSFDPQKRVSYN